MARPIVFVKLGGSLLTDKTRDGVPRRAIILRLAREVAAAAGGRGPRIVLGHGSGSFGHAAAAGAGLTRGADARRRIAGIARTQRRAAELHRIVIAALEDAGARPFSLAPSSFLTAREGRLASVFADPLFEALELGLLPVVYGDVVLDGTRGATIVSTEEVFLALAREAVRRRMTVARAIWLGETDGFLGADGATVTRLAAGATARAARRAVGASGTDVTGGIALRLRAAARLARSGIESILIDGRKAGALRQALSGRARSGTRVAASA
jgi:isopentenyl phosphate kinase